MNSDLSLEEASKRLEIAFKDTENRLDIIGEKVDSALIDSQKATGTSIISISKFYRQIIYNTEFVNAIILHLHKLKVPQLYQNMCQLRNYSSKYMMSSQNSKV